MIRAYSLGGTWARLLGLLLVVGPAAKATGQTIARGRVLPPFKETDFRTGKTIDLESFRGKVVLIHFWATWCGPCRAELPNIKANYEKYRRRGFEIISISLDKDLEKCREHIEKEKLDWYHIADGKLWDARLAKRYGIESIPRAILIGRDGKVISENARGAALAQAIEEGLKQTFEPEKDDEVEAAAKAKLAEADNLRAAGRYAEALAIYDELGTKYAARPTGEVANARARDMRADPKIMKSIEAEQAAAAEREAEKKGGEWLRLAREMKKANNIALARKYYQRVIDTYPQSKVAETARAELAQLPKE